MGLNHTAAMLSPEGLKTRPQPFQLGAWGTKSIAYSQHGRRANKAHLIGRSSLQPPILLDPFRTQLYCI